MAALHDPKIAGDEFLAKIRGCTGPDFTPPGKLFDLALQREAAWRGCDWDVRRALFACIQR